MTTRVIKKNNKFIPQYRNSSAKTWMEFGDGDELFEFLTIPEASEFILKQLKPNYNNYMNSIFILQPTRNRFGIWAFDDANTGLVQEPFVGDTNILIDNMVLEAGYKLESAANGIALLFSPEPFHGYQSEIYLIETTPWGSTYVNDKWDIEPWLCPAAYLYFPQAPPKIYSAVKM